MRIISIGIFVVLVLISCKDKNTAPNGILNKEQMQAVLWDVIRAEAFTNNFIKRDVHKDPFLENAKLQAQIFALHNTSKEEFEKSYAYYKEHASLMQALLDSMTSKTTRGRDLKNFEKLHRSLIPQHEKVFR